MTKWKRCVVIAIGLMGASASVGAAPPPLPKALKEGIQRRADRPRKESMQGTSLCGGDLEVSVFAGDLTSDKAAAPKAATTFEGWRAGKEVKPVQVTVSDPIEDPCSPGVMLYTLVLDGKNPCGDAPMKGADDCEKAQSERYKGRAVAVAGGWGAKAEYVNAEHFFTLSCAARGVVAKCAHWKYRPWSAAEAPLHRACVRAARADYCGNDDPVTVDNTEIDLFDRDRLRPRAATAAEPGRWQLESDWNEDGALCLDVPRLACCPDKAKLAATIRKKCGRDLPACKPTCPPDAPTCGNPIRTCMTSSQPGPITCDRELLTRFCR